MWIALSRRVTSRGGRGFVIRFNGPRGPLTARVCDVSEMRVLREVFAGGEYEIDGIDPEVILDLGSNAGLSVLYFRDRYPSARIIAVEPARQTFLRLQRNVGSLERVTVLHAAATDENGPIAIHSGAHSWNSSIIARDVLGTSETVPGMTVDEILVRAGETGADLVKMDIEGAEGRVLTSSPAIRAAAAIIFEFHQEHHDHDVWELTRAMPEFEVIRLIGHSQQHPLVTLRRR